MSTNKWERYTTGQVQKTGYTIPYDDVIKMDFLGN